MHIYVLSLKHVTLSSTLYITIKKKKTRIDQNFTFLCHHKLKLFSGYYTLGSLLFFYLDINDITVSSSQSITNQSLECLFKILLFINNLTIKNSHYLDNIYCCRLSSCLLLNIPIVINFLETWSCTDTYNCHYYLSL